MFGSGIIRLLNQMTSWSVKVHFSSLMNDRFHRVRDVPHMQYLQTELKGPYKGVVTVKCIFQHLILIWCSLGWYNLIVRRERRLWSASIHVSLKEIDSNGDKLFVFVYNIHSICFSVYRNPACTYLSLNLSYHLSSHGLVLAYIKKKHVLQITYFYITAPTFSERTFRPHPPTHTLSLSIFDITLCLSTNSVVLKKLNEPSGQMNFDIVWTN